MRSEQNDDFVRCRIATETGIGSFMQVYIPLLHAPHKRWCPRPDSNRLARGSSGTSSTTRKPSPRGGHGPYNRTHHCIANFVESKPDKPEISHRYCAYIGDGISTKYLVTTMIISHFNHLLWEVNRRNRRL